MHIFFKRVVVMIALSNVSIFAMRKTQSMNQGLTNLEHMTQPEAQSKLQSCKSMMRLKNDSDLTLKADTWFEQLKTHEIERNKLKQNRFSQDCADEFLRNIEDDMQRLQCSFRLLNLYFYCEKSAHGAVSERDSIKLLEQRYIKRAQDIHARILEISKSSKICTGCDRSFLEAELNEVRYLRKHTLHAKFGLHNGLKRSDVTRNLIYACHKYMHVDLTFAELERQIVLNIKALKNYLSCNGCPISLSCSIS